MRLKSSDLHLFKCRGPQTPQSTVSSLDSVGENRLHETARISEAQYPLLRRPVRPKINQSIDRPLPPLPLDVKRYIERVTTPQVVTTPTTPTQDRPRAPFPVVESSSSNLSNLHLGQPQVPGFLNTPEWQEFRLSSSFDPTKEIAVLRNGEEYLYSYLIPATPSPGSSGRVDSENQETSPDSISSTRALFHKHPQIPIHTLDTLQVILHNLEAIQRKRITRNSILIRQIDQIRDHLKSIIRIVEHASFPQVFIPRRARNFAIFLDNQIGYLTTRILDFSNLINPLLEQDIDRLSSCYRTKQLHQRFIQDHQST